jgi:hypothetical protein
MKQDSLILAQWNIQCDWAAQEAKTMVLQLLTTQGWCPKHWNAAVPETGHCTLSCIPDSVLSVPSAVLWLSRSKKIDNAMMVSVSVFVGGKKRWFYGFGETKTQAKRAAAKCALKEFVSH